MYWYKPVGSHGGNDNDQAADDDAKNPLEPLIYTCRTV